jgi:hypothetical protein
VIVEHNFQGLAVTERLTKDYSTRPQLPGRVGFLEGYKPGGVAGDGLFRKR